MGRNGWQRGLKNARRPGVCQTWVSNTQHVPQVHFSTRESASSPTTEPSTHPAEQQLLFGGGGGQGRKEIKL